MVSRRGSVLPSVVVNSSLRVIRVSPGLTWRALDDGNDRRDGTSVVGAETFGPDFDPDTYLVAADISSGNYMGLVRIWVGRSRSRLGLIAVLPPYRRRGVAKALLARALGVLHERGQTEISAEIDDTNTACLALLGGMGARRQGGTVEFVKRATT